MAERSWQETIQVEAKDLVDRVNRLFEEGNVRRIVLKQGDRVLFEIPLSAGVAVGAAAVLLAPVAAAVAAVAGFVSKCTIEIERAEDAPGSEPPLHASMDPHAPDAKHDDTAAPPSAG